MGRRLIISLGISALCVGILSACIASNYSWVRSTGSHAGLVQVHAGNDVGISVGLPKISFTNSNVINQSLLRQNQIKEIAKVIRKIIKTEEGFRTHPYLCSEGYVTIGYGTKLHNKKGMDPKDFSLVVNEESAMALLTVEVNHIVNRLVAGPYSATFRDIDKVRKDILISMAYQMGTNGLYGFKRMWVALANKDYLTAAEEMLDSAWAKQTPERAHRHTLAMSVGSLHEYM